jgi:hypothetical protein
VVACSERDPRALGVDVPSNLRCRLGVVPGKATRTLDAWSVYEVSKAGTEGPWTTHLTGFSRESCCGRVSNAIVRFDLPARHVLTASGRVYELAGRPGFNADALSVWGNWKRRNGVLLERDITLEVDEHMFKAGAPRGE